MNVLLVFFLELENDRKLSRDSAAKWRGKENVNSKEFNTPAPGGIEAGIEKETTFW